MRSSFPPLRLSISARLTLWYGLSLLLLLSLFVVFLYTSFHVSLHRDFEAQLRRDEARVREAVRIGAEGPVLQPGEALRSVALQTEGAAGTYVRLLAPSEEVLYRSPNFGGTTRLSPSLPAAVEPVDVSRTWQGGPARSRYAPLLDEEERLAGWLEVTRLESSLHHELHRLRWLLALGILLGTAVAIGSGYGLARRALRPVATITEAARKVEAEKLGWRLPTDFGVRDELTDLAETLNALLARLDASFERERRFRADAAHEMFTPLAAIESEVDVTLRKPREGAYYEETLETVRKHAQRLSGIVEGLLQLSRAEAIERPEAQRADVSCLVLQRLEHFRTSAEAQGVVLRHNVPPGVQAAVDPAHLETVFDNILDNAIKYTPPGGTVTVAVRHGQDGGRIEVADTGIGLSGAEQAQLFDRFYRSENPAVQRQRGGGLGLSIAAAIVEAYGGRIEAESGGPGRGSLFKIVLPRRR